MATASVPPTDDLSYFILWSVRISLCHFLTPFIYKRLLVGSKFGRMKRKKNPTGLGCVWYRPLLGSSTRSYVAITFTSPGHCVATMTQPLHSHSASRWDFFETFWGSDSSVGSLFSRLLSVHWTFTTQIFSLEIYHLPASLVLIFCCVAMPVRKWMRFQERLEGQCASTSQFQASKRPNIGMTDLYAVQIMDIRSSISRYINLTIWIGYQSLFWVPHICVALNSPHYLYNVWCI